MYKQTVLKIQQMYKQVEKTQTICWFKCILNRVICFCYCLTYLWSLGSCSRLLLILDEIRCIRFIGKRPVISIMIIIMISEVTS